MALHSCFFVRKRVVSLVTIASVMAPSFALANDPLIAGAAHSGESLFLAENATAMKKMMADMVIKPSGDVDRDFVAMMVPHHQGAVNMAKAELKYGHNGQLRLLAREIVANQQREITEMRNAISHDQSSVSQQREQLHSELSSPALLDGAMRMPQ